MEFGTQVGTLKSRALEERIQDGRGGEGSY